MELLKRIEIKPEVLKGKPVIKGTRLSVPFILNLLAKGLPIEEILEEYSGLEREDVLACLIFASETVDKQIFLPIKKGAA